MLEELAVRNLGPVESLSLVFGQAMTALSGETGAGKTVLTEAIKLLCGGQADSTMVRSGADEARVQGRFILDGDEVVVERVVPKSGRSRGYIDGSLASIGQLAESIGERVDIHGQHVHQRLLKAPAQRALVDAYGQIDLGPLKEARAKRSELLARRDELGGDERARNREIELYRFQLEELDAAQIEGPDEDERLQALERTLANATEHRTVGQQVAEDLGPDSAAGLVSKAISDLAERQPYRELLDRLVSIEPELIEVSRDVRGVAEALQDDPEQLSSVQRRRSVLTELRRKYGATVAEVLEYRDEATKRLDELVSHDERATEVEALLETVAIQVAKLEAEVGAARRKAAPRLGKALTKRVRTLALPNAEITIAVGDTDPGDDVEILVAMNSGADPAPLSKAASGGELSRTTLAIQLELSEGAPTMVFDEVDAGVGGAAANAIADALVTLSGRSQVLVVTHLAQVAAAAAKQVSISKVDDGKSTHVTATTLDAGDRRVELARMLSGEVDSSSALAHSDELLEKASARSAPPGARAL